MLSKLRSLIACAKEKPAFNHAMKDAMDAMKPGEILELTRCDGEEFTLIRSDDFNHLISLIDLRRKNSVKTHER